MFRILDSARPGQYGPRGFGGWQGKARISLGFAGVGGMSDGTRGHGERESRPADDADLSARLRRLGEQLDHVDAGRPTRTDPAPRARADSSGLARGLRLSSEFVIGVLVGAALGWVLDRVLGISPWGLIVFVLLGFVAGVFNLVRAVGAGAASSPDGREN
jgi:ATP synthase protein I